MNIAQITPNPDFTLAIKSDNGLWGLFDVRPYLDLEAFRPLNNINEFVKIQNGKYFVEWTCGADLSADTIFAKWQCDSAQSGNAPAR
jgi:hypothetical protein